MFFLEVKRYRSPPFWRHNSLKILDESGVNEEGAGVAEAEGGDDDDDERSDGGDEDFNEDNRFVPMTEDHGQTFKEAFDDNIRKTSSVLKNSLFVFFTP
jgi:hypothetical protein